MTHRASVLFSLILLFSLSPSSAMAGPADNSLEQDLVLIPAGIFPFGTNAKDENAEALSLGIPKPWYVDESPRQEIFLKAFLIDRYEVTNRRYKVFVDDVYKGNPPPGWNGMDYPSGQDDYPVTAVNWWDATNFCQWAGKALPTEKQWEKAARGEAGSEYPWGNTFDPSLANLSVKAGSKNDLKPVGSYPQGATPLGVQDMVGNVWEWVADDYEPYKGSTYASKDFGTGLKVFRGLSGRNIGHFPGSSYLMALSKFARSGYRQYADSESYGPDIGFRCVRNEVPEITKAEALAQITQAPAGEGNALALSSNPASPGRSTGSAVPSLSAAPNPAAPINPFAPKPILPDSGILALTLLSFFAGLFSFLSPCTLPILPAYFAVTAQTDRTRISLMSIAFFLGLAALFVLMGASASFLGQVLRDYLFSITTAGGFVVSGFGIMTLFGKGFSGAHFTGRPASSFIGFFLFGATFALGWTPCVGPVLSGILILAASDKTIFQGMSLLFFFAMGLGLPLVVISAFFGHLSKDSLFWRILRGKGWEVPIAGRTLFLHTTNLFSGILLIGLGIALAMGYMTYLNSLIPLNIQLWFADFEEMVLHWFM